MSCENDAGSEIPLTPYQAYTLDRLKKLAAQPSEVPSVVPPTCSPRPQLPGDVIEWKNQVMPSWTKLAGDVELLSARMQEVEPAEPDVAAIARDLAADATEHRRADPEWKWLDDVPLSSVFLNGFQASFAQELAALHGETVAFDMLEERHRDAVADPSDIRYRIEPGSIEETASRGSGFEAERIEKFIARWCEAEGLDADAVRAPAGHRVSADDPRSRRGDLAKAIRDAGFSAKDGREALNVTEQGYSKLLK